MYTVALQNFQQKISVKKKKVSRNNTILQVVYTHRRRVVRCFLCVRTLAVLHTLYSDVTVCAYFSCIHFTVMLAAGAYRSIERGHCASLQRRVTRLTNTWCKGLEIPGLFINTVGFVSFLNWICVFASPPPWLDLL